VHVKGVRIELTERKCTSKLAQSERIYELTQNFQIFLTFAKLFKFERLIKKILLDPLCFAGFIAFEFGVNTSKLEQSKVKIKR